MAKYNLYNEFIELLANKIKYDKNGNIIEAIFPEFKIKPMIKIGDKYSTHYDVKLNGIHEDRKVIDLIQDRGGNIVGVRAETYKNGEKKSSIKIAQDIKSETMFSKGIRDTKYYNNSTTDYLFYDCYGTSCL